MSTSVTELRARLAALMGKREGPAVGDDRREIEDMFAECQRRGVELGWQDEDEPRFTLRDMDPDEPLPTAREHGRRYCGRCGVHKRLTSFDDGAEHCRSHGSRPQSRASAA